MPLGLRERTVVWWSLSECLASLHGEPNEHDVLSMFTGVLFLDQGYRRLLAGGIVVDLLAKLQRRAEMRF